jgi:xylan 1,4-beta-xylosidase
MSNTGPSRRHLLAGGALATVGIALADPMLAADAPAHGTSKPLKRARGIEGQRKADLGNGMFLNPILADDYPDPSILKDGEN